MGRQIPLPLPRVTAQGLADFHISGANDAALAMIRQSASWPQGRLALEGPAGSGKTHLAAIWCAETGAERVSAANLTPGAAPALAEAGAVAVEDADRIAAGPAPQAAEQGLFHLHNLLGAAGGRLLVTGRGAPRGWPIALPDLASRLQAMTLVRIGAPDDALLSSVLSKLLADRQLVPEPGLVPYLLARIERSFAAAEAVIATLDARALEERRNVTCRFAGRVLAETGAGDPDPAGREPDAGAGRA